MVNKIAAHRSFGTFRRSCVQEGEFKKKFIISNREILYDA